MSVGIVGYGAYLPQYAITVSDIAHMWGKNERDIISSLGITQKTVPNRDEDTVTISIEAARVALKESGLKSHSIETILIGSESHPYAVNPTSTIVGELLGIGKNYFAADLEFACKAGTAAMNLIYSQLAAGHISYGLAIGADTAQSKPHDTLEYAAATAAVALVLGNKKNEIISEILDSTSYSSDTPDFWRRDGMRYPSHGGRFTGEPAYFTHVMGAAQRLFEKTNTKPQDFDYCIFHMPNGKFPQQVAARLGFTKEQLLPSLTVTELGNPYSASSLLGLAAVLDQATPNQTIFMISYGSGAGSDGFIFKTTEKITNMKRNSVEKQKNELKQISYTKYLKRMKIIG